MEGQTRKAGWPKRAELVGRGKGRAAEVDERVSALKPRKEQAASRVSPGSGGEQRTMRGPTGEGRGSGVVVGRTAGRAGGDRVRTRGGQSSPRVGVTSAGGMRAGARGGGRSTRAVLMAPGS